MWPDYLVALGILKTGRTSEMLFRLERWLLCNANRVVVVTNSFRQRLESKGVTLDRIDIVPNGVDVQHYRKREEPPPLAAMQARTNELIVGYLGTFGKGQALHIVIEAAALLRAWGHTIRFVFAGDGPELQRLVEAAKSLNADSDLVGLYPPIPREQTRAFYNSCDICVVPLAPVPIFDETVPSKLFEIMACETPLVASVGGEAADIVRKSGGGIVTRPGDPVALAEAILAIANLTENERMTMGRNAREFVRLNYDRISIADRYFEILHSLASAKQ
jgi:glycosyltransferase involved in cell wall biosynthesis